MAPMETSRSARGGVRANWFDPVPEEPDILAAESQGPTLHKVPGLARPGRLGPELKFEIRYTTL